MIIDTWLWYLIPLLLLFLFYIAYKIDRTKLWAGFLLSCSVISFAGIFCMQAYVGNHLISRLFLVLILLFFVFLITFGVYIFIGFLILNTRSILRKEKRDLKHSLTLILAIGLLLIVTVPQFIDLTSFSQVVRSIIYSVYGLMIYYFLHLTHYIISMILCNFSRPPKKQHYIIVLGCWIKDGRVTPILARRLDKAIAFYNKQKEVYKPPKLLLSGGKGSDETCSEAEAMKTYALEKGIPEEDLLLETNSISTLENMKFSKKIMDMDSKGEPYRCIYATNNYHLLRAGIFAKKAGLKVNGIGSKTAFYYLPNAILREYIAYLYIHLKWNLAFGVLCLISGSILIFALIDFLTSRGIVIG